MTPIDMNQATNASRMDMCSSKADRDNSVAEIIR
jgi:hypothetical protein